MKLDESLQECTLALLRRIAAHHSLPAADETLRTELASHIAEQLLAPGYVASRCATLEHRQKDVLAFLAGHEWMGKAFLLERQFPRNPDEPPDAAPCLSLLQMGLVYRSFGSIGSWRGELYHVPEELRQGIALSLPSEQTTATPDVRAEMAPSSVDRRDSSFDVFCLLSFLRRGDRRSYQGFLSRYDLPKLEQETNSDSGEPAAGEADRRWRFLVHLCLTGGWVRRDGYLLKPGRSAPHLLSGAPAQVRQRLLDRYLKDRSWSDLAEAGKVRQSLGSRRIDEAAGRQLLLHYLQEFAGSEWVEETRFCEAVRATNPDFLREDYASLSWAMVDVAAEAEVYGADSWDPVEGEWIRYVLRGPLYWLGCVAWGRTADGRRSSFRLVPDSVAPDQPPLLAGAEEQAVFPEETAIVAPLGVDLGLVYLLEPYLTLKGRDRLQSSYRFTRASVLGGLESGGSVEELRSLLQRIGQPPRRLLDQIEAWAESYGRIVLVGGILLTAATEEEADQLAEDPAVVCCLGERMSDRTYRVAADRVWQLVDALKQTGVVPRVDPSVGSQQARTASGDLLVQREALFSLLLMRALHGAIEIESSAQAQRRLEAALGPDAVEDVSRRVQDAVKRLRGRNP